MSGTELIVIAFGLFIGYWIVSKLMAEKPRADAHTEQAGGDKPAAPSAGAAWHDILDVPPQASVDEIRAAYKRLMSQYHPDKVASLGAELRELAERKSKDITSAYREAMQLRGAQA